MPFFSGFAAALGDELRGTRAENQRKAEIQAERENQILQHLSTSDDPEIASMALGGLISGVQGKPAKGIRGWLGEMEGNPTLPTIRQLMGQSREVQVAKEPDVTRTAAMPAGSPVEPGGRPLTPPAGSAAGSSDVEAGVRATGGQPPGRFGGVDTVDPTTGGFSTELQPRQVFLTPAERLRQEEEAKVAGRLSAYRWGLKLARTPEERQLISGMSGAPQRVMATIPGQLVLKDGSKIAGHYDPQSDQYVSADGQIQTEVVNFLRAGTPPTNPSAGLRYITDDDGTVRVVSGTEQVGNLGPIGKPQVEPSRFSTTTTLENPDDPTAPPIRAGITRGGATVPLGNAPPSAADRVDPVQALAQGVVAAVDKQIQALRTSGLPMRDLVQRQQQAIAPYNKKYAKTWSYEQWVAQAKSKVAIDGVRPGGTPGAAGSGVTPPPGPPARGARPGRTPTPSRPSGNPRDPLGILQ